MSHSNGMELTVKVLSILERLHTKTEEKYPRNEM